MLAFSLSGFSTTTLKSLLIVTISDSRLRPSQVKVVELEQTEQKGHNFDESPCASSPPLLLPRLSVFLGVKWWTLLLQVQLAPLSQCAALD